MPIAVLLSVEGAAVGNWSPCGPLLADSCRAGDATRRVLRAMISELFPAVPTTTSRLPQSNGIRGGDHLYMTSWSKTPNERSVGVQGTEPRGALWTQVDFE